MRDYIERLDTKFYHDIVEEIPNKLGEDKAKKFTTEDFVRIRDKQKDPARIKEMLIEEIEIVKKRIENLSRARFSDKIR